MDWWVEELNQEQIEYWLTHKCSALCLLCRIARTAFVEIIRAWNYYIKVNNFKGVLISSRFIRSGELPITCFHVQLKHTLISKVKVSLSILKCVYFSLLLLRHHELNYYYYDIMNGWMTWIKWLTWEIFLLLRSFTLEGWQPVSWCPLFWRINDRIFF